MAAARLCDVDTERRPRHSKAQLSRRGFWRLYTSSLRGSHLLAGLKDAVLIFPPFFSLPCRRRQTLNEMLDLRLEIQISTVVWSSRSPLSVAFPGAHRSRMTVSSSLDVEICLAGPNVSTIMSSHITILSALGTPGGVW